MVQYCIPNLLKHLQIYTKPDLNPNYDIVKEKYPGWIDLSGLMCDADQRALQAWEDLDMSIISCRFYPDATWEGIEAGMKYLMFSLLLEIATDAPATAVQAQHWADIFKQAFQQTLGETEGLASLINYTCEMVNAIKDPYRPRLIKHLNSLADGMVAEAFSRSEGQAITTLETYMKTRREIIAVRPMFDFARSIYDIDISYEVLTHSDIAKLENQVLDLIILTNDLYSYKKEYVECGAYYNYITIALEDPITGLRKNDRQSAIDYIYRKFCEILADLENGIKMLPSFGEIEDAKVVKYIETLMDQVVGNIQYSLECRRYGHRQSPEAPNSGDVVYEMDPL